MQFKHQYKKESNRAKDEWRTPDYIFNPLNEAFSFTLDAAANANNTKCDLYLDRETNGLEQSWKGERVWINPPYTEGQYAKWLLKAATEMNENCVSSALLVPASLETNAFVPVWQSATYLILPYKRISFLRPDGTKIGGSPFASAIVVFGFGWLEDITKETLRGIGHVIPLYKGYWSLWRR